MSQDDAHINVLDHFAADLTGLRRYNLGERSAILQSFSTSPSSRVSSWRDMSTGQLVSIALKLSPVARLTIIRCEKNYGPGIRARQLTVNLHSNGRCGSGFDDASCDSVGPFRRSDEANATQTPAQPSYGTATSTDSLNITFLTGPPTLSTTNPDTPYETTPEITYTEYTTTTTTVYTSSSASIWLLPTICFDIPTLCGTGPFPWTVHPHSSIPPTTNVLRMISPAAQPAAQTARLEHAQFGGLDPPLLRLRAAPSLSENSNPTGPTAADPSTLTTLPTPRKAPLPNNDIAAETLSTNSDSQDKKVIKPQPQTARMQQQNGGGGGGMDNPQAGGSDNGHPPYAVVVEAGSSIAVITPVASGVAARADIVGSRDDNDDREESRATHACNLADGFTGGLMAAAAVLFVVVAGVGL
jgi:hypothetical protein